ncbi:sigma factor regulatory protein, FecR/PupR family [Actinomyces denticolens]|nr:sigma factor regulatory protein, FecR/PupR family [Actinomyces denticolens]
MPVRVMSKTEPGSMGTAWAPGSGEGPALPDSMTETVAGESPGLTTRRTGSSEDVAPLTASEPCSAAFAVATTGMVCSVAGEAPG